MGNTCKACTNPHQEDKITLNSESVDLYSNLEHHIDSDKKIDPNSFNYIGNWSFSEPIFEVFNEKLIETQHNSILLKIDEKSIYYKYEQIIKNKCQCSIKCNTNISLLIEGKYEILINAPEGQFINLLIIPKTDVFYKKIDFHGEKSNEIQEIKLNNQRFSLLIKKDQKILDHFAYSFKFSPHEKICDLDLPQNFECNY